MKRPVLPLVRGTAAKAGFTSIAPLLVIAVVAILAGMLPPLLGKAKSEARGITYMDNGKQLMLAWNLYASENNDVTRPPRLWPRTPTGVRTGARATSRTTATGETPTSTSSPMARSTASRALPSRSTSAPPTARPRAR